MFEVLANDVVVAGPFDTPQEATNMLDRLRAADRTKTLRMRRVEVTAEMIAAAHERERQRLVAGECTHLPDWFPVDPARHPRLCTDVDDLEECVISIFPDDSALVWDRRVRMSASAYLSRYHRSLYGHQISEMAQRLKAHVIGFTARIVSDEKTIHAAYMCEHMRNEGSRHLSCMCSSFGGFKTHPCRVYGEGSSLYLAIGYINNKMVSRALVNIHYHYYVRIYGRDETARVGLECWLKERGYWRRKTFLGSRLKRIEHVVRGENVLLMPYIDGEDHYVDDHGSYLMVTDNTYDGYDAHTTEGYVTLASEDDEDENNEICDRCGEIYPADDGHSVVTEVNGNGDTTERETWCPDCRYWRSWDCNELGATYSNRITPTRVCVGVLSDGSLDYSDWGPQAVHERAEMCDYTGEYCDTSRTSELTMLNVDVNGTVERWCAELAPVDPDPEREGWGIPRDGAQYRTVHDQRQCTMHL